MTPYLLSLLLLAGSLVAGSSVALAASPWGANYFPNVSLTTHEGKEVRFFDDLIKDKIVAVNFIYTSCPDTCPLETAQLTRVQELLGDRLGEDIFFYSITIDPDVDTPQVLSEYRERFGARWTFLTGNEQDIILLRKKLGLYVEEIQDGSNNHNVNMIIGNQATGRWMKRSPFENPYVLADQMGNWLDGWKSPQRGKDYASAPKLRSIPLGEQLFRTRCASCHSLNGNEPVNALGPDLLAVTQRREMDWLLNWLRAPDQMLANKDPIALALFNQYKQLPMPNMRLNQQEAMDLIAYIDEETQRLQSTSPALGSNTDADTVAIMNAWVRETDAAAKVNAGYLTLVNVAEQAVTLTGISSDLYGSVELHEMTRVDGMMRMRKLANLEIPANGNVKLAPGGKHLMLKSPKKHLRSGEQVEMTLHFSSGQSQKIKVAVANK